MKLKKRTILFRNSIRCKTKNNFIHDKNRLGILNLQLASDKVNFGSTYNMNVAMTNTHVKFGNDSHARVNTFQDDSENAETFILRASGAESAYKSHIVSNPGYFIGNAYIPESFYTVNDLDSSANFSLSAQNLKKKLIQRKYL